jgi:hypothetical protein
VSDERFADARRARDHALRLIRELGHWETVGGDKVLFAEAGPIVIAHTTLFSDKQTRRGSPRSYLHAVAKQAATPVFCCSIDIWFGRRKVLSVRWDATDNMEVVSFSPGDWQDELAQIAPTKVRQDSETAAP